MQDKLPKDPMILLSVVNMKLRDAYASLDNMCDDMDVKKEDIIHPLKEIDYKYDEDRNQFV